MSYAIKGMIEKLIQLSENTDDRVERLRKKLLAYHFATIYLKTTDQELIKNSDTLYKLYYITRRIECESTVDRAVLKYEQPINEVLLELSEEAPILSLGDSGNQKKVKGFFGVEIA